MRERSFRVRVTKDYLKFSAAHFIAYKGFRERLHGHNYRVSVEVQGKTLGREGYLLDFGLLKGIARAVCNTLDEKVVIPVHSDCLRTRAEGGQIIVLYENDEFRFPAADVALLPIKHSSAEELARYVASEVRRALAQRARGRINALEIGIEETSGQTAFFREQG